MGVAIKEKAGEALPVLASKIGTANSTPLVSGAIPFDDVDQIMCVLVMGDMASETIDFSVQSVDSDGTSNAAALKAATQLAAHATANDNGVVVISVRAEELSASGKSHIRMRAVTGGATGGTVCMTAVGCGSKYGPGSGYDAAAVAEIKL